MSVLITGGAGFIGCHSAKLFAEAGMEVVVLDNLTTGQRKNVRWGGFFEGEIADVPLLRKIIRECGVKAVVHLAASAHVGDSFARPEHYRQNNVRGSETVLEAMVAEGVRALVFASSCSVYGNCDSERVQEDEALEPISPYGQSKLSVEQMLPRFEREHGISWLALRYFNACGAVGDLGENPEVSVRILPRAIHAAVTEGQAFRVFGTDYPTVDGTAVRDYVHVSDIARANLSALRYVMGGGPGTIVNIGAGTGVSVRQILEAVGRSVGHPVPVIECPPRPGDPALAVSDASRAEKLFGWKPVASDIETMVASTLASWKFQRTAESGPADIL